MGNSESKDESDVFIVPVFRLERFGNNKKSIEYFDAKFIQFGKFADGITERKRRTVRLFRNVVSVFPEFIEK